jgi:hypothetical protein
MLVIAISDDVAESDVFVSTEIITNLERNSRSGSRCGRRKKLSRMYGSISEFFPGIFTPKFSRANAAMLSSITCRKCQR